jgi:hypothetical protein
MLSARSTGEQFMPFLSKPNLVYGRLFKIKVFFNMFAYFLFMQQHSMKNIFSFWNSHFKTCKQREDIWLEKHEDEHCPCS